MRPYHINYSTIVSLMYVVSVFEISLLKGYSFYHSPRVKQLSFTVFESIQPIFCYLEEYQ